jgi:hypothetical protein
MSGDGFNVGIEFIGEMTKEDIVKELMAAQQTHMETHSLSHLKAELIQLRLAIIRQRMIKEAGLKEEPGYLGFSRLTEDDG